MVSEYCPYCNEIETMRIRDGTATRVCVNGHHWQYCCKCKQSFTPSITRLSLPAYAKYYNFMFYCQDCAKQVLYDYCTICKIPRYSHNPNKQHAFT